LPFLWTMRLENGSPVRQRKSFVLLLFVLICFSSCPWMMNCIGLYNRKFFVLFLFYLTITCMYAFLLCLPLVIQSFSTGKISQLDIWIFILSLFSLVFFFTMSGFSGRYLYLAFVGDANSEKRKPLSRDLAKRNFQNFFGTGLSWWWFWIPDRTIVRNPNEQ